MSRAKGSPLLEQIEAVNSLLLRHVNDNRFMFRHLLEQQPNITTKLGKTASATEVSVSFGLLLLLVVLQVSQNPARGTQDGDEHGCHGDGLVLGDSRQRVNFH